MGRKWKVESGKWKAERTRRGGVFLVSLVCFQLCGCRAGLQAAVRASNTRIEARDITVQGDFVTPRILAVGLAAVVPLGGVFYWLVIRPVVRPHRILRDRGSGH